MKAGWETKRLGDVCSLLNRGISPVYLKEGGICVLNQKCIRDHRVNSEPSRRHDIQTKKVASDRLVRAGDVLVNSTGTGTLGRVAQLREDPSEPTTVDSHVTIVRPKPGKFFPEFFGYMLVIIEDSIKESGEGCGGQTELARSVLAEKFSVHFPESLPEQQRIVGILDEAFEGIATAKANAEKNLQNARAIFQSHLQYVFTQRAPGWVEKRLGDVFEIGSSKRILETEWTISGIPFYGGKEIVKLAKFGSVLSNSFISEEKYLDFASKYEMPRPDDILITARGTIGVGYIVQEGDKFYYKDGNIIAMRGKTPTNPHFVLYAFKSNVMAGQLGDLAGTTVRHLPIEKAKELVLRMPGLAAQNTAVEKIRKIETETQRLESIYQQKISALDDLKKFLLHRAFAGEL